MKSLPGRGRYLKRRTGKGARRPLSGGAIKHGDFLRPGKCKTRWEQVCEGGGGAERRYGRETGLGYMEGKEEGGPKWKGKGKGCWRWERGGSETKGRRKVL